LDLKINEQFSTERRHLELHNEESALDLELAKNKIHDLIAIVMDLHQKDVAIKSSIKNIESYFSEKEEAIKKFQEAIKELREVANSLNPLFRDIQKKNIKFTLDKRDFYRECITDAFFYLSAPSKTNLQQLLEDKKILSQVIGIAKAPEPTIQSYYDAIEKTIVLNTQIDEIILKNKQKSIDEDMNFIGAYFRDSSRSQSEQGQSFLILVFIAIIFYIISIVIILRKF
jgi:chromosome segregation ATPase